jgi:hypothetical protein
MLRDICTLTGLRLWVRRRKPLCLRISCRLKAKRTFEQAKYNVVSLIFCYLFMKAFVFLIQKPLGM